MTIAHCPQCAEEVRIPTGVSGEAQVRCPLCLAEFSLCQILDRLAPELIVVLEPAAIATESASDSVAAIELSPDEAHVGESETSAAPAFEMDQAPAAIRPTRSARKEKSFGWEMAKVLLGGVVGLSIGQLILWWLPGQWRRDPFELGKHVSLYAPVIVPATFHHPSLGAQSTGTTGFDFPPLLGAGTENSAGDESAGEAEGAPVRQDSPETLFPDAVRPTVELQDMPLPSADRGAPSFPRDAEANAVPVEQPESDTTEPPIIASRLPAAATPGRWPLKPGILGELVPDTVPRRVEQTRVANAAWNDTARSGQTNNRKLAAELYRSLAALGEAVTAVDGFDAESESGAEIASLLSDVGRDETKLTLIGKAAPSWMVTARPHNGICVYGTVTAVEWRGSLLATELALSADQRITLLSTGDGAEKLETAARVLVLGTILDEPQHNLEGYDGDESVVVLVGIHVALQSSQPQDTDSPVRSSDDDATESG